MATGTITTGTSISTITGFCLFGEFRYGGNSEIPGVYERDLGADSTHISTGSVLWGSDPENGLDTGPLSFNLTIPKAGGSSNPSLLSLIGASAPNPLSYGGTTYAIMQKVEIRAGVQINAAVTFSDLSLSFYKGTTKVETYTPSTAMNPAVDTRTTGTVAESILTVKPSAPISDKIVVVGNFEFDFDAGVFPDVNDLFAQVYVFTSTCSTT